MVKKGKLNNFSKKIITILILISFLFPKITFAESGDGILGLLFEPVLLLTTAICDGFLNLMQSNMTDEQKEAVPGSWIRRDDSTLNIKYGIYTIVSNKVPILNADFITDSSKDPQNVMANTLRKAISGWFVQLRILSIALLAVVLVYIGIRMILQTTADGELKYKKMISDWVIAFFILCTLHILISLMFTFNNTLVNMIEVENNNGKDEIITQIRTKIDEDEAHGIVFGRFGYVVMYAVVVYLTAVFTIKYVKRVIYLAFLTLIAPLVVITYPIDKIGDGKAQAFNNWFKEFLYNLLIQPIDLLIYVILVSSALVFIKENLLYGIVALSFIIPAEKFIEKLFGVAPKHGASPMATIAGLAVANKFGKAVQGKISGMKKNAYRRSVAAKIAGGSSSKNSSASQSSPTPGTQPSNSPNQPNNANPSGGRKAISGFKSLALGATKLFAKSTTSGVGAMGGLAKSIATGDMTNVLGNTVAGMVGGYHVGQSGLDLVSSLKDNASYATQAIKNIRKKDEQN